MNLEDDTGNWPKWIKEAASKVKETAKKVVKAVKKAVTKVYNETKKFATATYLNRDNIIKSAFTSLELELNSGFGLASEYKVSGLGAEIYAKALMPKITISENSKTETTLEVGASVDAIFFEIGPEYVEYTDASNFPKFSMLRIKDTITITSGGIFVFYGLGYSLDFNVENFIDKVKIFYE